MFGWNLRHREPRNYNEDLPDSDSESDFNSPLEGPPGTPVEEDPAVGSGDHCLGSICRQHRDLLF